MLKRFNVKSTSIGADLLKNDFNFFSKLQCNKITLITYKTLRKFNQFNQFTN